MSRPLFVIGMQRNGTGICARIVRQSPEVYDGRFAPYDRWDIPAIGEIGGHAQITPFIDMLRTYFADHSGKYACAKIALPFAVESYGFVRLAELFPEARFVLIARYHYDSWQSWTELPYLQGLHLPQLSDVYRRWHEHMVHRFFAFRESHKPRVEFITYERLVGDADNECRNVWKMLNIEAPENLQRLIRKPTHWTEGAAICV